MELPFSPFSPFKIAIIHPPSDLQAVKGALKAAHMGQISRRAAAKIPFSKSTLQRHAKGNAYPTVLMPQEATLEMITGPW